MGIPRDCRDPKSSWELLKFLYLSDAALQARQQYTDILPPMREHWSSSLYHRPDPFYGGQRIGELYVALAEQIPARYVTPFTTLGTSELASVLSKAIRHVQARGPQGLPEACQAWLGRAAEDLRRRIDFGLFE